MTVKRSYNNNRTAIYSILISVMTGIFVQVVLCLAAALLVEKGSVAETGVWLFVHIIRSVGVCATVVAVWSFRQEHYIINAAVAVGIVWTVPIIVTMALWNIDISNVVMSLIIAAVMYILCILVSEAEALSIPPKPSPPALMPKTETSGKLSSPAAR